MKKRNSKFITIKIIPKIKNLDKIIQSSNKLNDNIIQQNSTSNPKNYIKPMVKAIQTETKTEVKKLKNISVNTPKNKYIAKNGIHKDGVFYWLRKLYIIIPDNLNRKKYKPNLCIYFYYPIKDLDIKTKIELIFNKLSNNNNNILICKSLKDIFDEIKKILGIPNNAEYIKIDLYNENYDIIRNDNYLMERTQKSKILYAKIKKIPDLKFKNRCFSHLNKHNNNIIFRQNLFSSKNFSSKKSIYSFFTNQYIINKSLSSELSLKSLKDRELNSFKDIKKFKLNKLTASFPKISMPKISLNKKSFQNYNSKPITPYQNIHIKIYNDLISSNKIKSINKANISLDIPIRITKLKINTSKF